MKRFWTTGLLLALLALAGCGGSSSSSSTTSSAPATPSTSSSGAASTPAPTPAPGAALKLAADPGGALKFDTTSLAANAGKVTIDFTNSASLPHNVTIASSGGAMLGATPTF